MRYQLPYSSHPKGARPEIPEEKSPAARGFALDSSMVPAGAQGAWGAAAAARRRRTEAARQVPLRGDAQAGCPAAQARYVVGKEEAENPGSRKG